MPDAGCKEMGTIDNTRASKGRGRDYEKVKEGEHLEAEKSWEQCAVRGERRAHCPGSERWAPRGSSAREGEQSLSTTLQDQDEGTGTLPLPGTP